MLKRDKNGFLQILVDSKFDLEQFESFEENRDDCPAFVIRLKDTPLEFWVRNNPNSFTEYDRAFILFGPKYLSSGYWPEDNWTQDINIIYMSFDNWLNTHVQLYLEELTVPDLWSQIENGQAALGISLTEKEDFTVFTNEEKAEVIDSIKEFRFRMIETFEPTEVEIAVIDAKLDYLIEATNRLNKFDWKSIFVSTLLGIVPAMSLDTSSGQKLYSLAKIVFSNVIGLLQ